MFRLMKYLFYWFITWAVLNSSLHSALEEQLWDTSRPDFALGPHESAATVLQDKEESQALAEEQERWLEEELGSGASDAACRGAERRPRGPRGAGARSEMRDLSRLESRCSVRGSPVSCGSVVGATLLPQSNSGHASRAPLRQLGELDWGWPPRQGARFQCGDSAATTPERSL